MSRDSIAKAVLVTAFVLLAVATLNRFRTRGGPYFSRPQTIVDHVGPNEHETRAALLALTKFAKLIPRGAHVTCFEPTDDGLARNDMPNFFTAVGQLPRNWVEPPFTAGLNVGQQDLVEYVVAIRKPFTHPLYHLVAEEKDARLYRVNR